MLNFDKMPELSKTGPGFGPSSFFKKQNAATKTSGSYLVRKKRSPKDEQAGG